MAFFGKAAGILKQAASVSRHINNEMTASKPSIFQMIRSMSSSKVFIGGLSYNTDEPGLRDAFSKYGEVIDARVIVDRETMRSRGFGFVTYASPEDASSAIQALDGQDLDGRTVRVNFATDKPRDSGFGGGGGYGGGGGGYGGGGGGYGGVGGNYGGGGGQGGYQGGGGGYQGGNRGGGYGGDGGGGFSGGNSFGNTGGGFNNAAAGVGDGFDDDFSGGKDADLSSGRG